jgi:four helix bundle protein
MRLRLRDRMKYNSFKDMPVWKETMDIAETVFKMTEGLPKKEDYGLTSQVRRSALSMSGNIAEAFGRYHINDKINFYYFSRGSITETSSHLEYGVRVGYFDREQTKIISDKLDNLLEEINRLVKSLKSHTKPKS